MDASRRSFAVEGYYDAARAAVLSGVPRSTVYWWARADVVVPSVSPLREKLWSYADLMALRIVSWLRHPKTIDDGEPLPASPMPQVRRALELLDERSLNLSSSDGSSLVVDRAGEVFVVHGDTVTSRYGQAAALPLEHLDLTAPFGHAGAHGPDLVRPRPLLQIVPAHVAGEPFVAGSRITTRTLYALGVSGYPRARIASMYGIGLDAVHDALDLEHQLAGESVAA